MDAFLFAPVAVAIALTPGPNNFCSLNNGIRAGVGAALVATVGRVAAFAIFLTVSAVGLGAMLLASETAFAAVKWVGACYLFWLGWRAWNSREFSGLDVIEGGEITPSDVPVRPKALIAQEFLLASPTPKPSFCLRPSSRSSSTRPNRPCGSLWCWGRCICAQSLWRRRCMPRVGGRSVASSARRVAWCGSTKPQAAFLWGQAACCWPATVKSGAQHSLGVVVSPHRTCRTKRTRRISCDGLPGQDRCR